MAGRRSPASVAFLRFGIFLIVLGASLAPAGSTLGIVGLAIGAVLVLLGFAWDRFFGRSGTARAQSPQEWAVEQEVFSAVVMMVLFYGGVAAALIYNQLYLELGVLTGLAVVAIVLVRKLSRKSKPRRRRGRGRAASAVGPAARD